MIWGSKSCADGAGGAFQFSVAANVALAQDPAHGFVTIFSKKALNSAKIGDDCDFSTSSWFMKFMFFCVILQTLWTVAQRTIKQEEC